MYNQLRLEDLLQRDHLLQGHHLQDHLLEEEVIINIQVLNSTTQMRFDAVYSLSQQNEDHLELLSLLVHELITMQKREKERDCQALVHTKFQALWETKLIQDTRMRHEYPLVVVKFCCYLYTNTNNMIYLFHLTSPLLLLASPLPCLLLHQLHHHSLRYDKIQMRRTMHLDDFQHHPN